MNEDGNDSTDNGCNCDDHGDENDSKEGAMDDKKCEED